jgi:hypothetical protein
MKIRAPRARKFIDSSREITRAIQNLRGRFARLTVLRADFEDLSPAATPVA